MKGSTFKIGTVTGVAILGLATVQGNAWAALIVDVGPGGAPLPCGICGNVNGQTFGYNFNVNSSIRVNGLGAWDFGADGIGPDVQVGLWTGAGTLLASTTISDASSPEPSNGNGVWLFEDIPTLTLSPGLYAIGLTFFNSTPLAQFGTTFTTIPEITYLGAAFSNTGPDGGLLFPNAPFLSDGVFGPNLRTAAVPTPALLPGLIGMGVAAFKKRKQQEA